MQYCSNCGTQLPDGTAYCNNCGAPLQAPQVVPAPVVEPAPFVEVPANVSYTAAPPVTTLPTPAKIMGIISMICGILSLCSCYVGFIYSIPALILSNIANNKSAGVDNPKARLGKTLGIIGIPVSVVCLIGYIIFAAAIASSGY